MGIAGGHRFQLILAAVAFWASASTMASTPACGEAIRQTAIYRALSACRQALAASTSDEIAQALKALDSTGYCRADAAPDHSDLPVLCADPNGYFCSRGGAVLDSKCHLDFVQPSQVMQTPDYVEARCRWSRLESGLTDAQKIHGADELLARRRALIYTAERIRRMQGLYDRVQRAYRALIAASTRIGDKSKSVLLRQLDHTRLALDPKDFSDPSEAACFDPGPAHLNDFMYNSTNWSTGAYVGKIRVCAGQMANLDNLNSYALIHLLSHEVAHSFDPCEIEKALGIPYLNETLFPGTSFCLRGGVGPHGCNQAVLHCNELSDPASHSQPSCWYDSVADDSSYGDASDYKKTGHRLDQIGESFADFMGSEVTGYILAQDRSLGHLGPNDARDALLSITSEYGSLHGPCLKENTRDTHLPGFLRVNRVILSSRRLREALGCAAAPATPGAGVTCEGF